MRRVSVAAVYGAVAATLLVRAVAVCRSREKVCPWASPAGATGETLLRDGRMGPEIFASNLEADLISISIDSVSVYALAKL
jgi:hypothetical protein